MLSCVLPLAFSSIISQASPSQSEATTLTAVVNMIEPSTSSELAIQQAPHVTALLSNTTRVKRKRRSRPGCTSRAPGVASDPLLCDDLPSKMAASALSEDNASKSLSVNDSAANDSLKCAVCGDRALGYAYF